MYRPRAYAVDDVEALHWVMRKRVFATVAAARNSGVQFAYTPVVLDHENGPWGGIRFHLARQNPLAELVDGERLYISVTCGDAYISPDWYRTVVAVPTWNYIAVQGEGAVRGLSHEELRLLVVELSAQEEEKLAPKPPWTIDKLSPEKLAGLLRGIVGFSLSFERLEGKLKLSQDKKADDIAGVIAGLNARGDPASRTVATAMRAAQDNPAG